MYDGDYQVLARKDDSKKSKKDWEELHQVGLCYSEKKMCPFCDYRYEFGRGPIETAGPSIKTETAKKPIVQVGRPFQGRLF